MKKRLTRVTPLRAGVVLGVLYGMIGLVAAPFFLLAALIGGKTSGAVAMGGVAFAVLIPVLYAVLGFIGGIIAAFFYNLVAKWTGGLEFEVSDSVPAS